MYIRGNDAGNLLTGSDGWDEIYGFGGEDWIFGGDGNDHLIGGLGPDHIDGGYGIDTVDYRDSDDYVGVNLTLGIAGGGTAEGDVLTDVENVIGSTFGDYLIGSSGANTLWGWDGADQLYGYGGADYLYGGNGDDILIGGAGADFLAGEGGIDTVAYTDSSLAVSINLAAGIDAFGEAFGTGWGGDAKNDVLYGIEKVFGSSFDDVIVGSSAADYLHGDEGSDRLEGADGADTLIGGADPDTLIGGAGADILVGGNGLDVFIFSPGEANGDTVVDFEGNAGAAGDTLMFSGYGAGATFTQIDDDCWQVNYAGTSHDVITFPKGLANTIYPTDYFFV